MNFIPLICRQCKRGKNSETSVLLIESVMDKESFLGCHFETRAGYTFMDFKYFSPLKRLRNAC
jgi:hypothetical protein